ncbi:HEAT repeat domain-containing protein [Fimbriimonas ginsengisoli]|uniref:HEAT repeat domain-containing protein n=1 Tax=Fimbriimonas ginsengisoli Gsoil 348 TaxID=661478 RepID=A0A068NJ03_FIMGI|nr:HEAT repeat domain-containing protein [Fimbriimonas ginsengisoli]AIE83496.1 hypothetical protein OP10G_0128 [Fimbriimonas ginsengisoli Gsoil 348]
MTLAFALVASSLFGFQGTPPAATPQTPSGLIVEKKSVDLTFPAPAPTPPSAEILAWHGWGYLNGAAAEAPARYLAGYNLTSLEKFGEQTKAITPTTTLRVRFVVFERTETEFRDAAGVLRLDQRWTPEYYLRRTYESIARLALWVAAETGGKVKLVPEISVEHEIERSDDFGPAFARRYFGPRINGGGYEAEDKIFRGPYQSAIYILPGADSAPTEPTWVNGTPVQGISNTQLGRPWAPGDLDVRLHDLLQKQMLLRLAPRGYGVEVDEGPKPEDWAEVTATTELPTSTLLERLGTRKTASLWQGVPVAAPVSTWKYDLTDVELAPDPERGQVLHVTEKAFGRNSGVALPVRKDGQPLARVADTPTLSFSIRTKAEDTIGLAIHGNNGHTAYVTLGRDVNYRQAAPSASAMPVPLKTDGTWQKVGIDLKPLAAAAGFDSVTGISIEPAPISVMRDRRIQEPIVFDLDEIRFTSDPPTPPYADLQPSATSPDSEERALFAAKATASSPELVALIVDPSSLVRLNAADAYLRIKDDLAQPNLIKTAMGLDPVVGATALRALAHQGGQIAMTTVEQAMRLGLTSYTREAAARILGETKEARYVNDFQILLTDRSARTRVAAAEALANMPGKTAALLRMQFLEQEDPEIKLAVTTTADPNDEYQMRKLLWSAVNEPSDAVRAASDIKLISSTNPQFRTEGYKGVRDDSRTTRLIVLESLAAHPDEAHRAALRLAVTDRSAEVRAAALRGFAALEKGAEPDEIANVLDDRHPSVQLALIDLAKRHGMKLSDATKGLMASSPDERVKAAMKDLPATDLNR